MLDETLAQPQPVLKDRKIFLQPQTAIKKPTNPSRNITLII